MIEFRVGFPGGGKGYSVTRDCIDRLINTRRIVVTNMVELKPVKIAALIAKRYPKLQIDLSRRLFFIPKEDTIRFYRYRGFFTHEMPPTFSKTASVEEIDKACTAYFDRFNGTSGVDYFITEAHRHFKADTWSSISDVVMFYASQHRHFDDNILIETQVPKLVVTQFRDIAELTCEMSNKYRERFGIFQKRGRFVGTYYHGCPRPGTKGEVSHVVSYALDLEIAQCYDTRGAVHSQTLSSGEPETDIRKRGLPFWTIFPMGALAAILIIALIWNAGSLFGWVMKKLGGNYLPQVQSVASKVVPGIKPQVASPAPVAPAATETALESTQTQTPASEPPPPVRLKYAAVSGPYARFVLTDGTIWTETSPELEGATYRRSVLTLKNGRSFQPIR